MRKVMILSCFAAVSTLAASVGADTLAGLPNITVVNDAITDITYDGVNYIVADGDLSLGTTTRWWLKNGVEETLWPEGDPVVPGNGIGTDPKAGDVGSHADNFLLIDPPGGATNISSLDGIEFQETVFPFATQMFFLFERGGNDAGKWQAINMDGSLGPEVPFVRSDTQGGPYANTGVSSGQAVYGVVFLTNAPAKGVRITAPGHDTHCICAPTPSNVIPLVPTADQPNVDIGLTFQWTYSDEADVQVDSYTIYMDTSAGLVAEPNLPDQPMLIDGTGDAAGIAPASASDPAASYGPVGLQYDAVFYWRIVANVREPNSVNPGIYDIPKVVYSSVWSFATATTGPAVDAGYSVITWLGEDGTVTVVPDADITDATGDLKSVKWSVLGKPIGGSVIIADDGDIKPVITVDVAGAYLLSLWADDLAGNTGEDTVEITVYSDNCQAAKNNPAGYAAPIYDFNNDCRVSLADLEVLLISWLQDSRLTDDILF